MLVSLTGVFIYLYKYCNLWISYCILQKVKLVNLIWKTISQNM